ncbi:MAG: histidinol-phosphate transaminase [Gammaproteobacteria bacterium]|nr:histidinol-phosphate transaminase [Gammaproteobacteria bacterium]MYD81684.1 histidinol-phosphate transaminase [Gammaproteobacteria bacterium]
MNSNVNARVLTLSPYKPGKTIAQLEREYGVSNVIKLASNENPRGASPRVCNAISKELDSLTRYPDPSGHNLKQALSRKLGVPEECITLGNGSNDVLELAARVAVSPGSKCVVDEHCFVVYPLAIAAAHGKMVSVKSRKWCHDLVRTSEVVDALTSIVYIANPNNPTGTYVTDSELRTFIESVPSTVWIVIDEAYFEYVGETDYPNGVEFSKEFPNVVVTRTFSKAYGLASLRVGYSVSSSYFAELLNRIRQPFNVNSVALAAAEAALDDTEYLDESVVINSEEMKFVQDSLREQELEYIRSVGNFITFDCGMDALPLYEKLLRKGIIVRPIANYGMPNHLRVTIGTHEENVRFIHALAAVL